jgi:hypothetical protein
VAFYSDKHSIFRVAKSDAASGHGMTQFGRALAELNVEILCANSSQAKGRVERANRTLQDRLVKEMRLEGISSMEAANAFLPSFIARHNLRFARVPARSATCTDHWSWPRTSFGMSCAGATSAMWASSSR